MQHYLLIIPFALVCCAVTYLIRLYCDKFVTLWLLVCSIIFYILNDFNFTGIIFCLIIINIVLVKTLLRFGKYKNLLVVLNVLIQIGTLVFFKYINTYFLNEDLWKYESTTFPLGLSWIVFLNLSLMIDVKNNNTLQDNVFNYALYSLFFGTVLMGPIGQFANIGPQLKKLGIKRIVYKDIMRGLSLMIMGSAKIYILGVPFLTDISLIVSAVNKGNFISMWEAWYVLWGGMISIYFQFSGYSDIAIAIGIILGIKLPINFNSPLQNFDRTFNTWHISFTEWIRVYFYFPFIRVLNRIKIFPPKFRNINAYIIATISTFVVVGAWHGHTKLFIIVFLANGILSSLTTFFPKKMFDDNKCFSILKKTQYFIVSLMVFLVFFVNNFADYFSILNAAINIKNISLGQLFQPYFYEFSAEFIKFDGFFPNLDTNLLSLALLFSVSWVVAYKMPNTMEIFGIIEFNKGSRRIKWKPNLIWGLCLASLAWMTIQSGATNSEWKFIYNAY